VAPVAVMVAARLLEVSQDMRHTMRSYSGYLCAAIVATASTFCFSERVVAQEPKYSSWKQVEAAPETRDFLTAMKGGGGIDASASTYLEEIVFPQFSLPENRGDLDEVRNRVLTRILASFATDEIQNSANALVAQGMQRLLEDDTQAMGVRLNALLLIGELQAKSGGLWPGAVQPLTQVAADDSVALSLRIAAMIGLNQHLSRAAERSDPAILSGMLQTAEPALLACLSAPEATTPSEQVAAEWLTSQVLRLLPSVMPKATATVAGTIFETLADTNRGLDVRVRAAYALGTTADAAGNIDVPEAVAIIESLAIESLASDVALADERTFERDFLGAGGGRGGFGGPGGMMMGSDSGMAGMSPGGMSFGGRAPGGRGPGGRGSMGMGPGAGEEPGESPGGRRSTRGGRGGEEQGAGSGRGPTRGGMGSGMMGSSMGSGMMGSGMMGSSMGSGMMGPGMGSGGPGFGMRSRGRAPVLESGICLRTAWRLQMLADALAVGDPGDTGLVTVAAADDKPAILELAQKLREQSTMSSAATCLAIHRREDLPAWEQVVHRRVVLVVGGPQAPVPEALQASREDQLEQPRAAVSHLKAVVTNRLIPSASSLPSAYENKQRRSGCSRSALLYFVPDVRPLKKSACGSPTRGYSLISSRTVMPDGIIGSTCSWYGTWTSRRAGPSASISR
jgi:hypothetical protein